MNHQAPSRLHALASWLPATFSGLGFGFFGARVAFEMWPARFAGLATWPGTASVVAASVLIALVLHWLWSRWRAGGFALISFSLLAGYVLWPQVNLLMAGLVLAAALGLYLAVMLRQFVRSDRFWDWAVPGALAFITLAAYLQTVGQTVGEADTFEFQVVAPTLGVAHPTGYPLLILIGKLFSLIPLGTIAWRVNLVSVVMAVVATVLVYLTLQSLTRQRGSAALAALCLAFSRTFWSQATAVEVYTLNAAFVAAILWLLIGQDSNSIERKRRLFTLAAVYGLSFTNHLTMVMLGPAIVLGVVLARPRRSKTDWLLAAACFVLPLLILLYIPIRWAALHGGPWMSINEFFAYATGQQFRGALQMEWWRDPARWRTVSGMVLDTFGRVGTVLGALGLIWLIVRRWRVALVTCVAFAGYWFYGLVYNVPDISVFLIPAHIIMVIWIGSAAAAVIQWLSRLPQAEWKKSLAHTALALLPLSLMWANGPLVDQSQAGLDLVRWGQYVMRLPMPSGSVILADSEKIAPLYYLKRIENVRSDVETLVLGNEALYRAKLDELVAQGKPTYLARYLPGLAGPYRLHSVGPLVRVTTRPMLAPPPADKQLADVTWGNGQIALLGADVEPGQGAVAWRITLYWQARAKLDADYHVRLRWVGPSGHVWWQDHGAHPVGGYNPTGAWQPGEVIADYHEIPSDAAIPPGLLLLDVGWFLPFLDQGPNRDGAGTPWYPLVMLESVPTTSRAALSHGFRASFGEELLITGASDLGVLPPSEPASVMLQWSSLRPSLNRTLQLSWVDARGLETAVTRLAPYAGEYPTLQWPVGQALTARETIPAPAAPGLYTLRAGWLDESGQALPARCAWLAAPTYDCALGQLSVEGQAQAQGINFDNQVILLDAQLEPSQLQPNGMARVNLKWQGLRQWNADYTAFVHLLGPDGKLHGQVDQWPLDGTLATRDWQPGRVIDDAYRVIVASDAPTGTYQVEVGWYLLATLRRLPVVDAQGRPLDDRAIIGTVTVNEP